MVHGHPTHKRTNGAISTNGTNTSNGTNGNGISQHCKLESREASISTINQPSPPDGGWGWVVVFGSFMIHIITDGMTYSFGLFYIEFLDYFNEGKGYTAWIVSILVGATFASGPISSSFVNRYGCRAVTIAGSILAAGCITASIFAQNVLTLIITIGLGTGLGFGLIYLPAIVSVTTYFEAKRSLATGIAVCGSGFGTFVFAPLTENLIGNYGWRGAMLIIGGIVLNCAIFGAMFRPLEPPKSPTTKIISNNKSALIDSNTTPAELEPLKAQQQYLQLPQLCDVANIARTGTGTLCRSNSVGHASKNHRNVARNGSVSSNGTHTKILVSTLAHDDIIRTSISHPHINQLREERGENLGSGTMYRPDVLYQGSLLNIPEYRSRNDISGSGAINRYGSLRYNTRTNQNEEVEKCCGCVRCSKETRDTFTEMMNFSLLKDWIFIIFAISNFCTSIGFNMPYVYVAAQAETLGLDSEQSSYLIAIIGIANTVGRIVLGYISDKPWVNRLLIYNLCLTLCGVATALSPSCTDINSLGIYCATFGFTIGAYVGLTSVILVDLLGLNKLTNAFGLLLLFQGVASFIGPPIGGWLYDITESYSPAFILAGVMIAISGLIMFAIPPIQSYYRRKIEAEKNEQQIAFRAT